MNMNKKIIIIVSSILLLLIFLAGYLFFTANKNDGIVDPKPGININQTPKIIAGDNQPWPEDQKMRLQTQKGYVTVNNFYKTAKYIINDGVTLYEKDDLFIGFDRKSGKFTASVSKLSVEDFNIARNEVESIFLDMLGISKDDACKLDVEVVHSQLYSGYELIEKSYPLSFCN